MSSKIYDMRDTWVDSALQYTSIKMNTFDVSSSVSSRLLDLKKNGLSQFTIDKFGKIVTGTLDIPRVNNLEETITALSSAGLAKVDFITANTTTLAANLSFANNSIALVYKDPILVNNDWYYKANNTSWANTGLLPALAQQLTPRKHVERTFYVTMNGNDNDANTYIRQTSNTGMSIYKPFQTIGAALLAANAVGKSCVIIVHPGEYEVAPNTEIPAGCALYGYDARVTKLSMAAGLEENNMFLLNSGIKVRGFTFTNLRHEASWLASTAGSLDYGPPKKGYAFAFKPGVYITRSPYIGDCAVLHNLTYQEMSSPQERATGNPLVPMTGGCVYADGAVVDPDSPLRSVVVDSFTAVNPNGIAYAIINNALVQLVSVFTNWSRVGIWSHAGGQVTIVNSNATFGDYAFAATGFRYAIRVPGIADQNLIGVKCPNFGTYIKNNVSSIATKLNSNTIVGFPSIPNWTTAITGANIALSLRDTETILKETAEDLITGQDKSVIFWTQSLFVANTSGGAAGNYTANSVLAFSSALKPYFLASWNKIRTELKTLAGLVPSSYEAEAENASLLIDQYFDLANNVISNPLNYTIPFPSKIEAASHQFSYAGSGVNYNALPFGQRASGAATNPTTNLYQSNGGIIYATFNTEQGDTYLGKDLKVDFERSTIEGQAFSRGVQNITLPLIVGIGG